MQIFVKLPENEDDKKEWALIEMQGELESRLGSGENLSGKFIGDLVRQLFHGLTILSHKNMHNKSIVHYNNLNPILPTKYL